MRTKRDPTGGFLYEEIAAHVENLIMQGTLRQGDKVPSIRAIKAQLGVSVATVQQAYSLLENKGLIESRPQSGYYVRHQYQDLLPEPDLVPHQLKATGVNVHRIVSSYFKVARENPDMFLHLGTAAPDVALLPVSALSRSIRAVVPEVEAVGLRYDFPPGYKELRRQLAIRSIEYGCSFLPDEIMTTAGALEALNLCLKAITKPGDIVAIESPTYFGILQTLEHLGLRSLEIPTHPKTGVDLKALEKALKGNSVSACLLVPNFSNPMGSLMPDENKEALMALLERHNTPLIEDDVYGDVFFLGKRPKPVKAFDKTGLVMLCSSFTKTLAPGFRVGWVVPGRFGEQIRHLKFMTSVGTSTLPQMAVAHFLKSGEYERHLRQLRRELNSNAVRMATAVFEHFPAGTRVTQPQGGIVLWVEMPPEVDAVKLYQQAMIKNILVSPGVIFSTSGRYQNFLRLNFACPWTERLERAIRELGLLTLTAVD